MRFLQNTPLVFFVAMILGLTFPSMSHLFRGVVIPTLAFVMTLSLGELEFGGFDFKKGFVDLILNYAYLGGIIIFLSSFLTDQDLKLGFIVMAAAPPAVAIVPFSKLLGGDVAESTFSSGMVYLASLILTPLIVLHFTGRSVDIFEILKALIILILIPLAISRIFKVRETTSWINLGFALVIYTVIGLNAEILYKNAVILLEVFLIGIARTFVSGSVAFFVFRSKGFAQAITKALFSSYKNLGFTAGVSLILFGERASMPAAVCIFMEIFLFNYYFLIRKKFDNRIRSHHHNNYKN